MVCVCVRVSKSELWWMEVEMIIIFICFYCVMITYIVVCVGVCARVCVFVNMTFCGWKWK